MLRRLASPSAWTATRNAAAINTINMHTRMTSVVASMCARHCFSSSSRSLFLRPSFAPRALHTSRIRLDKENHSATNSTPSSPPPAPASVPSPSFVTRILPPSLLPYSSLARLDKPIGTWLLLWPCWWAIAIAAPPAAPPALATLAVFATGAFVMRGAGCTINDLWDRDIDGRVLRTKERPLAAGSVNVKQAMAFLLVQLSAGLAVVVQLNSYTIALSFLSIPIVVAYPYMKRVFPVPQLVLGLAFNWGALVGYSAVAGAANPAVCLPLYIGGICWTLIYDTIYAHQDKDDDKKLGLNSAAIYFGERSKQVFLGLAATNAAALTMAGHYAEMGPAYFAISVAGGGLHLLRQIATTDLDNREQCKQTFESNTWYGLIVFIGIVIDKLMQKKKDDDKQKDSDRA